ncbi:glucan endo-1,3-beta-glucosidase 3-like isoform X1 [Actinidia eriantha]|uniref:glucan endo-1,3-beta-glucosidase 3-like isoform X1 n=1 Tax=Actinidia eriantha TaxID=165200 RepID=UPI0025859CBA|nr:glucan endo-1,3-beta-glucosidase 3-like isoform X1 [Actinidia eriantha]
MLKMVWLSLFSLFSLYFLALTGSGHELVEQLTLYDPSPVILQALSHTGVSVVIAVGNEHLNEVSNSVDLAENWVRTHVLSHYPATKITTIVVGNNVLCNRNQNHLMGLVLPCVKNLFHSLTRWGLEREITVSASLSSDCLNPSSVSYRDDLADKFIKPLLEFLQSTNSTYLVNPPPNFSKSPEETLSLVSSHTESMKNIGGFDPNKISFLIPTQKESKPITRKLSFMESVDPYPPRPTPLAPTQSPIGFSVPDFVAKSPLPPLVGPASPLPFSLSSPPKLPPIGFGWPPCNPPSGSASQNPPILGAWCVAKPSVPAEKLQEVMDYACGEGGADCEAIRPHGNCYSPDTVVAHASYAFNSYWQKNKRVGGTCSFGGTAMLINADPSFQHCQFILI